MTDSPRKPLEYIRIELDFGDLSQLNRFSADGWRVVSVVPMCDKSVHWALLEREVTNARQ